MSYTTPHTPTRFQEIHGIKLAPGGALANLVIERLALDPVAVEAARFWYNSTDNKFKLSNVDSEGKIQVQELAIASEVNAAVQDLIDALADTTGTDLIGFAGITEDGPDGEEIVPAGTLTSVIKDIYSKFGGVSEELQTLIQELASTEVGEGSAKIGFSGSTKKDSEGNNVVSLPAGTVEETLILVDSKIDALEETVGDGRFLGTESVEDQSVISKVTFKNDIVIEGDLIHKGENLVTQGTTVELGDNIILLNREVSEDATPVADAGLQVNRGKEGVADVLVWQESDKSLKGIKVTIDEDTGEETVSLEKIAFAGDLENLNDNFDEKIEEVEGRLNTAEGRLNTAEGRLDTAEGRLDTAEGRLDTAEGRLDTAEEDISNLDEKIDAVVADLASSEDGKGAELVGYQNEKFEDVEDVKGALDALVEAVGVGQEGSATFKDDLANANEENEETKGFNLVGGGSIDVDGETIVNFSSLSNVLSALAIEINRLREEQAKKVFAYTSAAAETHTIAHNLNSQDIAVQLWIKDGSKWMNHSANVTIEDDNTISVNLSTEAEVKVVITVAEDYVPAFHPMP